MPGLKILKDHMLSVISTASFRSLWQSTLLGFFWARAVLGSQQRKAPISRARRYCMVHLGGWARHGEHRLTRSRGPSTVPRHPRYGPLPTRSSGRDWRAGRAFDRRPGAAMLV